MSEQSSEVSAKSIGANRYSDHELDRLSRKNLFRNLERMRVMAGLSQQQVSTKAGRGQDWLKELGDTDSYYWKYDEIHDWARALHVTLRFNTVGLAVLPEEKIPAVVLLAEQTPVFSGIAMVAYLVELRKHLGHEQKHIAQRMDVNHGTMYAIENSNNPRLSTLQRYARALGGALMFEGQNYPQLINDDKEPF